MGYSLGKLFGGRFRDEILDGIYIKPDETKFRSFLFKPFLVLAPRRPALHPRWEFTIRDPLDLNIDPQIIGCS